MPWPLSVAIILTIGSISSTSGAEDAAACAAPPPASVAGLLSALESSPGTRIKYREEIRHPALPVPEVATGTMWVGPEGQLIRDQLTPRREISEIDENILRVRNAPDAEPVIYPIPDRLRGPFDAMRFVVAGGAMPENFDAVLAAGQGGWRLMLDPATGPEVTMFGCEKRVLRIETEGPTGVSRSIRFLQDQ